MWEILLFSVLVFLARLADVTLGTLRIVYVSRGMKLLSALLGFFEVLIWIVVVSQVIQNLNHWVAYLFYAGGFSAGVLLGMMIEERLAMGYVGLRIMAREEALNLCQTLRAQGYALTTFDAEGKDGPIKVIYLAVKRKDLDQVLSFVRTHNPRAFYTIEEVRSLGSCQEKPFTRRPPWEKLKKMD
ncbi:MAG: hypothetical protein PWP04_856 [Candidatus Atribacteria bacterium]|nr:hypothetical protein [Candidatus Atribacteria bacterium]